MVEVNLLFFGWGVGGIDCAKFILEVNSEICLLSLEH